MKATRWLKPGDHPDVRTAGPTLTRRGGYGYISGMHPLATHWVGLEKLAEKPADVDDNLLSPCAVRFSPEDGPTYWRYILPFALWKIRGDRAEEKISEDDELFKDCLAIERVVGSAPTGRQVHGWLRPAASDGRVVVYPGDWIVDLGPKRLIVSDEDYHRYYVAKADA